MSSPGRVVSVEVRAMLEKLATTRVYTVVWGMRQMVL